jgi:AraC-like DNA-binding protein
MHLVFRLSGPAVRLFESDADPVGRDFGHAIVSGARSRYWVKEIPASARSVGVQLRPGAAEALFGASAAELAERHFRLEDLWGREAESVRERLMEAGDAESQIRVFASILDARLPKAMGLHPCVAMALADFGDAPSVGAIVRRSGYSHRAFVAHFRRSVGLAPKAYGRVVRFRRALARIAAQPSVEWSDLALAAGYSDQAHLCREFRELAGVSPREYRRAAPAHAHHVALGAPGSISFKTV